ncbi:hypothetical protein HanXRQr2_Chr09g0379491 [Helianthus annuus]|uniref:Uncharacterized protein n=1 Tax=Helianthus annuus TaxID=4232 RepID=A0A9K3N7P0_HELAN|nr:hypothetical protein HanXRQr2_Chr09g0379491 [Helianthus annuus]
MYENYIGEVLSAEEKILGAQYDISPLTLPSNFLITLTLEAFFMLEAYLIDQLVAVFMKIRRLD